MKERVDPLLLPHRPARTNEKTPPRPFSTRTEYFRKELNAPGMIRVISRSTDSVFIERSRDGIPCGDMRFGRGDESRLLERAVELARTTPSNIARNVGSLALPSGASIQVGARAGCVLVRWILPDGEPKRASFHFGEELEALRLALSDLHAARRPL